MTETNVIPDKATGATNVIPDKPSGADPGPSSDEHIAPLGSSEITERFSWRSRSVQKAVAAAIGIYLASRLAVLTVFGFVGLVAPDMSLFRAYLRWDSGWFIEIIAKGYPTELPMNGDKVAQNPVAFFPGYPSIARVISEVFGVSATVSAVITSFLLGIATTVLLWRLVTHLWDSDIALKAVALFWFFPGSHLFSMAYSEVLMVPAAIACLLCLFQKRWVWAGLLAIAVTASRSNGMVIALCCAWASGAAIYKHREWKSLIAVVLAPLGTIAYHLYLWNHTGEPRAWFRTQSEGWAEKFDFGARAWDRAWLAVRNPSDDFYSLATTLCTLVAIIGIALLIRYRARAELIIFTIGMAVLFVGSQTIGYRPRFLLGTFPLIIAFAIWAKGWRFPALIGTFATLMACFTMLSSVNLIFSP
jgi:hypothetical protein